MIKLENVNFSYPKKLILENINLNINCGERVALFAPSGYGKTTILRLIMGLIKPKKGTVNIKDGSVISVVFQEDRLIPQKTVYENVKLFSDTENIDGLLDELGIAECKNELPKSLSGGMARRVAIARALSKKADIYLFDEPFSGLDKDNLRSTANVINKYTKDKTVILVSHSVDEANLLETKIINL